MPYKRYKRTNNKAGKEATVTEQDLYRLFSQDLSVGTHEFCDALLARCLDTLDSNQTERALEDEDLEMLSAAGIGPYQYLIDSL